jgi:hypothetical protein
LTPYLLAGVGSYRTKYTDPSNWHFGISAGGGVRVRTGAVTLFTEARVHHINDGFTPRLAPVSFGIRF